MRRYRNYATAEILLRAGRVYFSNWQLLKANFFEFYTHEY